jgi:hypothetical protein
MTVKGSTSPVQVASTDFIADSTGRLVSRPATLLSDASGRRRLLQYGNNMDASAIQTASIDSVLDQSTGLLLTRSLLSPVPGIETFSFASPSLMWNVTTNMTGAGEGNRRRLMDVGSDATATQVAASVFAPVCSWNSDGALI